MSLEGLIHSPLSGARVTLVSKVTVDPFRNSKPRRYFDTLPLDLRLVRVV